MNLIRTLLLVFLVATPLCGGGQSLTPRNARYLLRPGDVILVDYRYTPEYNATVSVQPDGFSSLPFLGDVKLGGLSLPQARDLLTTEAGKRLNAPEITVELKEFDKPHYIVGGEVATPGRYDLRGRVTALRAVEMAGGFRESGKASQVLLIRPINEVDAETRLIDLKKVTQKHYINEDIELRDGDMLIVPKTRLAKVAPYLKLVNAGFYINPLNP